ncbi:MAG: 50S ribosomal protein L10 [Phycisphaerales bacterium]|nr:50S ribosomal protein L10 [Phycisphaerales bacterium]
MSKPVKNLLIRDYAAKLSGVENAVVVSLRGIPSNDNNNLRLGLRKNNIRVTVVRNNLVKHAFKQTKLEAIVPLLNGPSALVYGAESVVDVAREVVKFAAKLDKLELRGAILDGVLFEGKAGVEELSKFPTRAEALAQTVTLILSPAQKLVGQLNGPGRKLAGIVQAIEKKLEKGETIAKVG